MSEEYQKYDSDANLTAHNVRLTGDAKEIPNAIKITYVLSSRLDKDIEMWVDAVTGKDDLAKYLRKGDVLSVSGFPTFQRWGDAQKVSCTVRFARFHYPVALKMALLDRRESGGDTSDIPL